MDKKTASQDTLDETFESLTPYEPEEVPHIEQIDTPPLVSTPKAEHSRLKNKLSAFASPFKTSKGFHLGPIKRGKLDKDEDSDKDITDAKGTKKVKKGSEDKNTEEDDTKARKKKKSGARSRAGALVRRLGSLGARKHEGGAAAAEADPGVVERRTSSGSSSLTPTSVKRRTSDGEDGAASDRSVNDESGSRYGSVEDVDMQAPLADAETTSLPEQPSDQIHPPLTLNVTSSTTEAETPPIVVTPIATTHPVSTLPFAVSTWKPKSSKSLEIVKPIESPSPKDAIRRRISFVEQTTICISEDRSDSDESNTSTEGAGTPATRLSRMVHLARLQRLSAGREAGKRSRSLSPTLKEDAKLEDSPKTSQDRSEDEYEDPETNVAPGMAPYGDLIEAPSTSKSADAGNTTLADPALTANKHRREHLYKVLVIGELGAGKTSIIKRYVHQFFSQHYRATIGVDFALKVISWDSLTTIRLQLWDIAGQERFGNMTRVYYKEAVGAFVVFDVTRATTFEAVVKWKQDLDSKVQLPDGSPIPCVLLGNKCDQQKEGIINNPPKMEEYCKENGFCAWYETSAKENVNIEEAVRLLVTKILQNDKLIQADDRDAERFVLDGAQARDDASRKTCSC